MGKTIEFMGEVFFAEYRKTANYNVRGDSGIYIIHVCLNDLEDYMMFPWEKISDRIVRHNGEICHFHVYYPGGHFRAENGRELRERGLDLKWQLENPVTARIRDLRDNRSYHEARMAELDALIEDGQEPLVIALRWDDKRQKWGWFRTDGEWDIVYVVNDKNPRPDLREPGRYYCKMYKYAAVIHKPYEGRRGFRLDVIEPLFCVYDTDEEIARLRPYAETDHFPECPCPR